ncbi:ABC transporter substrate-binding protein [Kineococcus sp. NPDC059986]|jgi:raffinose/stachyose/melibiose transport system substrate-binding protein|uniref:ABC transporter substrate-binding protein n=1 Tax=Kineococcus sp. NPDC059986 TaxID=3155538 RepID=UPI0034506174
MDRRAFFTLAAASSLVLAACSDPGAAPAGGDATPAGWPSASTKLDGVTLTVWAAQNSNTVPKVVVEAFQKATGAKVDVVTITDPYEQSVQTKIATGDKPDLAFWQPTASMLSSINAKTNLQPLTGAPWVAATEKSLQDLTGIYDDVRYAALISTPAVIGVYYNKQVLQDAGITATPADWTELVAAAQKLKAAGKVPFFEMGGNDGSPWATQWWVQAQLAEQAQAGLWKRVNAAQEKFTDPAVVTTIQNYKDLIDQGMFNADIKTATFEDQGKALLDGSAAMVMQVNSFFAQLQSLAQTDELNQKIGFFPISTEGTTGTFIPDQSNALVAFRSGDDKREAATRQLLAYWLGDGYQAFVEDQKTVSLQPDVATPAGVPEALKAVAEALKTSVGSMQVEAVANPDLYLRLGEMIQGALTPEKVAEQVQAQFAQLAAAQGIKGF